MGYFEARIAYIIGYFLEAYLEDNDIGFAMGADGPVNVDEYQMRYPDVSFFSWERIPNRLLPRDSILDLVPDFPIEVISPTNTRKEMERKRGEYFAGGCKLVWEVFPEERLIKSYSSRDVFVERRDGDVLNGESVLPGFTLAVTKLFD